MVIETLSNWGQVFDQMKKMQAAGLIDGFILDYPVSPQSSLRRNSFYSFSSSLELDVMSEALPGALPSFQSFTIEKGNIEVIGGKNYQVLTVCASF